MEASRRCPGLFAQHLPAPQPGSRSAQENCPAARITGQGRRSRDHPGKGEEIRPHRLRDLARRRSQLLQLTASRCSLQSFNESGTNNPGGLAPLARNAEARKNCVIYAELLPAILLSWPQAA